MEKLELKHLAPYLPYGLNGIYNGKRVDFNSDNIYTFTLNAKPIFKPLPFKDFTSRDYTYNEWIFFFKGHFDVFGLIEKGLAIDINTL
jgi:hypothetical protein